MTLAAMHTQAISSLLVTTAVTRAARPMTASTSATISIGQPYVGGRVGAQLLPRLNWLKPPPSLLALESTGAAEPRWPSSSSCDSR